jgi:pimeloyl-ACP methyl ester carboxylesterase
VSAYALEHLVADVVGLLAARGVTRTALVGHDWGAVLAWAVVAARPDLVDRLVVLSVGHPAARAQAGLEQQLKGSYILAFLVPGLVERLLPLGGYWWLRGHGAAGARRTPLAWPARWPTCPGRVR